MGAELGPFWLSRRLAGGRTGEVWSGVHRRDGVQVAVKFLTVSKNAAVRAVFTHEVETLASLDHPNIVRIWDHGVVPEAAAEALGGKVKKGAPYLVMEQGRATLGDRKQPLSWPGVRQVAADLLAALAHAHARGLLHRDLKPANVLLCPAAVEGERHRVVLSDFGFSGATGEETQIVGFTPAFAAPEQLTFSTRDEGPWTDLFALGCVVVSLLTGASPYDTQSPEVALQLHARPLPKLAGVEPGVDAWVRSLLTLDPAGRPASAAEALEGLQRAEGLPVSAAWPATWRRPEVRWEGPRNLAGAGVGLVGLRAGSVGHDAVRDQLWEGLGRAAGGRCTAIMLRGVEGIGKTHLADWLGETAHERWGTTELAATTGPGGVAAALRKRLGVEGLPWREGRARIAAWLQRTGGAGWLEARSTQQLLEPGPTQPEHHAPLAALLKRAALGRPLVLRLEDAQDQPDALAFAKHLLTERPELPVLVLATVGDEELRPRLEAAELVRALVKAGATPIALGELRGAEADRLVGEHLGLAPELRGALAIAAAGNPGVAHRLLRRLVETGGLVVDEDGLWRSGADAPVELTADDLAAAATAVRRFVSGRGESERWVFELAAALGRDVATTELDACARAAGLTVPRTFAADLVAGGQWSPTPTGHTFVDARVASATDRAADQAGRARRWHELAAGVLTQAQGGSAQVRRAHHLQRVGRTADAVVPWRRGLLALADEQPLAETVAEIRSLDRAIRSLRLSPGDPLHTAVDELLAVTWLTGGELERARKVAVSLAERARGRWRDPRSAALRVQSAVHLQALEVPLALAAATAAVEEAETPTARVPALLARAEAELAGGRVEDSSGTLQAAAQAAAGLGLVEARVWLVLGATATSLGRRADARALLDRASQIVERTERPAGGLEIRDLLGRLALAAGDLDAAIPLLVVARDGWVAAGQVEAARRVSVPIGAARLVQGRTTDAVACFREAARSSSARLRAIAVSGRTAVAAAAQDTKQVERLLSELGRLPHATTFVSPEAADLLAHAAASARRADPTRAAALAALARGGLEPLGRGGEADGDPAPRWCRAQR